MQVKKYPLDPNTAQQTGSKLGKEYVKAIYCHPAYLTYMQNISCWSQSRTWLSDWTELNWLSFIHSTIYSLIKYLLATYFGQALCYVLEKKKAKSN